MTDSISTSTNGDGNLQGQAPHQAAASLSFDLLSARQWQAGLILLLVSFFCYFNSFQGSFVFDDTLYMQDAEIQNWLGGKLVVRPLISLSLTANYKLDGYNTRSYHALNLAVHYLASWVLYALILQTLTLPVLAARYQQRAHEIALAAALLWLVHPLQTQSVTYIIQRCESMMGLFYFLTLWAYLQVATSNTSSSRHFALAGCLLFSLAAAGCKEMIVTAPFVIYCYDVLFLSRSWWRGLMQRLDAFLLVCFGSAVSLALLIWSKELFNTQGTVGFNIKTATPLQYLLTQPGVILHYLQLTFWPVDLCMDYLDWPIVKNWRNAWPAIVTVSLLGLASLVAFAFRWTVAFLGIWFFAILAPTSSFVPLQDTVMEHRMYLPLAAVVLGFILAFDWLGQGLQAMINLSVETYRKVVSILFIFLLIALSIRTLVRNEDYGNSIAFYRSGVLVRPENPRALANFGAFLLTGDSKESAEPKQALEILKKSDKIRPQHPATRTTLAKAYMKVDQHDEAIAILKQLIEKDPKNTVLRYDLGNAYFEKGEFAEAKAQFQEALSLAPTNSTYRLHLAHCHQMLEEIVAARTAYQEVAKAQPHLTQAMLDQVRVLLSKPQVTEKDLQNAQVLAQAIVWMETKPSATVFDLMGIIYSHQGHFTDAIEASNRAITLAKEQQDDYQVRRYQDRLRHYQQQHAWDYHLAQPIVSKEQQDKK